MTGVYIDLTGHTYSSWTVVGRAKPIKKRDDARWMCKCKCGNEGIVNSWSLRNGRSKSCGCYRSEAQSLGAGEAARRYRYRMTRNSARRSNKEFSITYEEYFVLASAPCFYCGSQPGNHCKKRRGLHSGLIYQGLDRKDSKRGYVIDNVVPCCAICNRAKYTMSQEDFYHWADRMSEYRSKIK